MHEGEQKNAALEKVSRFEIDDPYLNEEFEVGFEETIQTPYSRHELHNLYRTKNGKKLFVEKYPDSTIDNEFPSFVETPDFMNEFFESNLLNSMMGYGILDKEKFLVPSIKLSRTRGNRAYYSEYIHDTFSSTHPFGVDEIEKIAFANNMSIEKVTSLREEEFFSASRKTVEMYDKFLNDFHKKENASPLALLHLVAGDKDRTLANYRYKVSRSPDDTYHFQFAVLDMAGGWGEHRNKTGSIALNLLLDLTKDEVMSYWPQIKSVIKKSDLVNRITEKLPLPQEFKDRKRNDVVNNIYRMEDLVDEEFLEKDDYKLQRMLASRKFDFME
jgi:hypothetical protein